MSETSESRHWWRRAEENNALLIYLCDVAGVQAHTWWWVTPDMGHPDDQAVRVMVETGDNGSGRYVMVTYHPSSDAGKLVEWLRAMRLGDVTPSAEGDRS